jgi:hypothetical protein
MKRKFTVKEFYKSKFTKIHNKPYRIQFIEQHKGIILDTKIESKEDHDRFEYEMTHFLAKLNEKDIDYRLETLETVSDVQN